MRGLNAGVTCCGALDGKCCARCLCWPVALIIGIINGAIGLVLDVLDYVFFCLTCGPIRGLFCDHQFVQPTPYYCCGCGDEPAPDSVVAMFCPCACSACRYRAMWTRTGYEREWRTRTVRDEDGGSHEERYKHTLRSWSAGSKSSAWHRIRNSLHKPIDL